MQDELRLQDYNIFSSSTIILHLRLWGGSSGPSNPKGVGGVSRSSLPKGT